MDLLLPIRIELSSVGGGQPERITGHQGFAERNQLAVFRGGFLNPVNNFGDGLLAINPHGSDLGEADPDLVIHASSGSRWQYGQMAGLAGGSSSSSER